MHTIAMIRTTKRHVFRCLEKSLHIYNKCTVDQRCLCEVNVLYVHTYIEKLNM